MRGDGTIDLCKSKSPKTYEVKGDLMNRKMVEAAGIEPASCDKIGGSRSVRSL